MIHPLRGNDAAPGKAPIATSSGRVEAGAKDPERVADAAARDWGAVHESLSPVIGQLGVATLYRRTLHLARVDYPWLAPVYESDAKPGDFTALRAALAQQDGAVAMASHDIMLLTLHQLLGNLIGPSLTARLLEAAASPSSAGAAVQDPAP